jgi:hypothetical protein
VTGAGGAADRRRRSVRERARGYILIVAAGLGLAAEVVSTVQDGVSFVKVVALACFAFVFWYGWDLVRPPRH